jgi:cytochrome c oxidase cbb3-type subunit 4
MELNDFRSAMTVVMFLLFIGIVIWAFGSKRKRAFDEAANLPFEEDDPLPGEHRTSSRKHGA